MRISPMLGLCESVDFGMTGSSASFPRYCSDLGREKRRKKRGGGAFPVVCAFIRWIDLGKCRIDVRGSCANFANVRTWRKCSFLLSGCRVPFHRWTDSRRVALVEFHW